MFSKVGYCVSGREVWLEYPLNPPRPREPHR